jgi:DNA-binding transcriptional LysR family regulator
LALRIGPLVDSSLVARRLCVYSSHVYASTEYLLRHGEPSTPEELRQHRALAMPVHRQGGRFSWCLRNGRGERDFGIDPILVGNDPASLHGPLVAGVGLALMPDGYADESVDGNANLVRLLPDWHGQSAELFAVYPAGRAPAPKLRAFVDFIVEQLAQISCINVDREILAAVA